MRKFFVLWLFFLPSLAQAGATDKLKDFIASTQSAQANFVQEVKDKSGKRIQLASGTMQFVRPGKFRWVYRKPFEQIIVGDGQRFWLYDVELNQVVVKKIDTALGSSPAALLSGRNEIERDFELSDREVREGLDWLQALPRKQDSGFDQVLMAFNSQSELIIMELRDAFGHTTVLRFSKLQRNPQLPAHLFKFVLPKGVDVLGE
jgi:outer membrane lipoprotein carrier protein